MIILIALHLKMFFSQEYCKNTTSEDCASYVSFKMGKQILNKKLDHVKCTFKWIRNEANLYFDTVLIIP